MKQIREVCVLLLCWFCAVTGDIMVYIQETHRKIDVEFRDMSSTFGSPIPPQGIKAFVVYSKPATACTTIAPPPTDVINFTGHWAVLIQRGDCNFEKKIREAQAAGYDVAIVHNVNSSELMRMQASNPEGIIIPSIFVGSTTGLFIKDNYLYDKGYYIFIDDDESPFDIGTHLLLPFAVVVAICFIAMIGFMVVKCIKDHRRARRHRLPNSSLKKIPTAKFKKGDPYETCAICLDDFVEGEKLRILPCSHGYHCKCIDPWLTRNKRVCPMCKRLVFAEDETVPTDSESGSDYEDDNTPLLRNARNNNQGGGTFTNNDLRARLLSRFLANLNEQSNWRDPGPSHSQSLPDSITIDSSSANSVESSPGFHDVPQQANPFEQNATLHHSQFQVDILPPPPDSHSIQANIEGDSSTSHDC